jgi:4,5-DOPA dioxygenase extradiol
MPTADRQPVLFVSHGPPTLMFEETPARAFLLGLGPRLQRPRAVLCVSAHWEDADVLVDDGPHPRTIHDFYGFPPALYRVHYPSPGAPDVARRVAGLLSAADIPCASRERGLDHGAWCVLSLLWPAADVPALQLSLRRGRDARTHFAIGAALAALRDEGVLLLGSGNATHNLAELGGPPGPPWAAAFDDWLVAAVTGGRRDDLLDYRKRAPDPERNHPTEEHIMPLFVALGAAGGVAGDVLHRSWSWGTLAMSAFGWR